MILMWEFTSGFPPFNEEEHSLQLRLMICEGVRPKIFEDAPQCYIDLMKRCWHEDPLKRPEVSELVKLLQIEQKQINDTLTIPHPQASCSSTLIISQSSETSNQEEESLDSLNIDYAKTKDKNK